MVRYGAVMSTGDRLHLQVSLMVAENQDDPRIP